MGFPSSFSVDLDVVNPVELNGIPTAYNVDVTHLPKIDIEPITLNPISLKPMDVSLRVKEIPSVRTHIPAAFTVGFSILGLQIASIRLCGEAQIITEPYVPNPCEECGGGVTIPGNIVPQPVNTVPTAPTGAVPRRKGK